MPAPVVSVLHFSRGRGYRGMKKMPVFTQDLKQGIHLFILVSKGFQRLKESIYLEYVVAGDLATKEYDKLE